MLNLARILSAASALKNLWNSNKLHSRPYKKEKVYGKIKRKRLSKDKLLIQNPTQQLSAKLTQVIVSLFATTKTSSIEFTFLISEPPHKINPLLIRPKNVLEEELLDAELELRFNSHERLQLKSSRAMLESLKTSFSQVYLKTIKTSQCIFCSKVLFHSKLLR